jgi:peptidyl-prolyl cis-trans isomerase B (cyclophilin B)
MFSWRTKTHRDNGSTALASKNQERAAREARERLKAYNARQEVHAHATKRRFRDNLIAIIGVVVVAGLAAATQIFYFQAGPGAAKASASASASASPSASASAAANTNVGAPDPSLAAARTWTGTLTLNGVALGVSLDGAAAPQAVSGIIRDVQDSYYVDKTCHRLAQASGFGIIQCGSLDGTGAADPAFSYGPVENAPSDNVYKAGTIAMARASGNAYSNGHQFFIAFDDSTIPADAAGGYTVVGTVTSGLDELKTDIVAGGITAGSSGSSTDGSPTVATKITAFTLK